MESSWIRRATAGASLGVVLTATLGAVLVGLAIRQPCASGNWGDGRQYRRLCYSDIVPLYSTEALQGDRLPYIDQCPPDTGGNCDEYPVLTMYTMRLAAWVSDGLSGFFYANVTLLALAGLVTSYFLYRMAGPRALLFALSPTLIVYAFVNWDLLAVALTTAATFAYFRRQDGATGVLLGLGAAAKLYPGLLVIPFALGRVQEKRPERAALLAAWAAVAYVAVNLPFALAAPRAWWTFFRFNSERGADWDSLWFVGCVRLNGTSFCDWSTGFVNVASLVALVGLAALVWFLRRARTPDFPRWSFGFPLLILFLLTNKVYSPQYGLWLIPWFVLALPNMWLFAAFSAADVAVFITRFTWFGRLAAETGDPAFAGYDGATFGMFQLALVIRAIVLIVCVVAWVRGTEKVTAPEEATDGEAVALGSLSEAPA